ncbi:uncharacterized protein JCM15063_002928 [Sporobolomyces koalae]|uniref:uncharacterized protein n=1 Tax=Sporobolomyces koalae TaxID=500713 RepID=UPI00317B89B2
MVSSPFSCFSSTSFDDRDDNTKRYSRHRPYSSSRLPPLSASVASRNATPLLSKRPPLRFDKKRPSYGSGSSSDGSEKRPALRKAMIGNPTAFVHVGGAGGVKAADLVALPLVNEMSEKPREPIVLLATNHGLPGPPPRPPRRERSCSLPVLARPPLGDTSNRHLALTQNHSVPIKISRRQSLAPSPKRKPAPPVTPSVLQQSATATNQEQHEEGKFEICRHFHQK